MLSGQGCYNLIWFLLNAITVHINRVNCLHCTPNVSFSYTLTLNFSLSKYLPIKYCKLYYLIVVILIINLSWNYPSVKSPSQKYRWIGVCAFSIIYCYQEGYIVITIQFWFSITFVFKLLNVPLKGKEQQEGWDKARKTERQRQGKEKQIVRYTARKTGKFGPGSDQIDE